MKSKPLAALAVISLLFTNHRSSAADTSKTAAELNDVITQVQTKLKEGKKTEAELAPELKAFDDLLAKYKDEKTDDVAQILYMKYKEYEQVLGNHEKSAELVKQLKQE